MLATQSINAAANLALNARFPIPLVQPTFDVLSPDFRLQFKALSEGIPQTGTRPSHEKKSAGMCPPISEIFSAPLTR
jgi:hypothetical protein